MGETLRADFAKRPDLIPIGTAAQSALTGSCKAFACLSTMLMAESPVELKFSIYI